MEKQNFDHFLAAIRQRDSAACEKLVADYEPVIRRLIRMRLTDDRLRRTFDSMDICQSIMAAFFQRTVEGRFQLTTPDQLRKLLITMALNNLRTKARTKNAVVGSIPDDLEPASADSSPSDHVAKQELLEKIRLQLDPSARRLFDLNAEGQSWEEIGRREGRSAATVRMQVTRAIARVRKTIQM